MWTCYLKFKQSKKKKKKAYFDVTTLIAAFNSATRLFIASLDSFVYATRLII